MQWSYLESFQDSPSPYLKKNVISPQQTVCRRTSIIHRLMNVLIVKLVRTKILIILTSCKPHIEPVLTLVIT